MSLLESFHHAVALLPDLAKFAIGMVLIIGIPRLSPRRRRGYTLTRAWRGTPFSSRRSITT